MGNYKEWIIQYHGNLQQTLQGTDTMFDLINERYAIVKARDKEMTGLKKLLQIEQMEESRPMRQVTDVTYLEQTISKEKHGSSGKGVTVGWITYKETINYRNYNAHDGKSRILCVHDGTKEYSNNEIIHMKNNATNHDRIKKLSYMDMCVGNKGIAPESDIILVNWKEDKFYTADAIRAVRFIIARSKPRQKSLVIHLPFYLGSGGDKNRSLIEEVMDDMSLWGKIVIVGALETGSIYSRNLGRKSIDQLLKLLIPMSVMEGVRTLDLAYELAPADAEIDAFIIYNNLKKGPTIMAPELANLYPLVFPYFGVRGTVAGIKEFLRDQLDTLVTGSLAYILGNEPLGIKAADFKVASILNKTTDFKGAGTLVGIIDTGIDYTHPTFIDDEGKTRIVSIWDQTIGIDSPYGYGTVYDQEIINEALQCEDPFEVVPHQDEWGHGTILAGISAGYSKDEKRTYKGVAPEAGIVVVKLMPATPDMQKIYHSKYNPLGFSALDVARAFEYIATVASQYQQPVSICLPMGSNTGSHDGTSILDTILMSYAEKPGITVILSAGEEANKGHHASGNLKEEKEQDVKLTIPQGQGGFITEIWAMFGDRIEVSLTSPKLEMVENSVVLLNKAQTYRINNTCFVWSQGSKIDTDTGCQVIRFRLENPTHGEWVIGVRGVVITSGRYDIWIPKTGMVLEQTILEPANPFTTIYNASASTGLITVVCYDRKSLSPTPSSGRGFARDDRVKPDFMVPGVDIPGPLPGNKWGTITGTGASSAITTGVTSLRYESQLRTGEELANTLTMKALLVEEVKREPTFSYPDRSRGYGLLDISTVVIRD